MFPVIWYMLVNLDIISIMQTCNRWRDGMLTRHGHCLPWTDSRSTLFSNFFFFFFVVGDPACFNQGLSRLILFSDVLEIFFR